MALIGPQPNLSYREIFTNMVDANLHRTPREFVPEARRTLATVLTFLLPKGCLIRTAQVRQADPNIQDASRKDKTGDGGKIGLVASLAGFGDFDQVKSRARSAVLCDASPIRQQDSFTILPSLTIFGLLQSYVADTIGTYSNGDRRPDESLKNTHRRQCPS